MKATRKLAKDNQDRSCRSWEGFCEMLYSLLFREKQELDLYIPGRRRWRRVWLKYRNTGWEQWARRLGECAKTFSALELIWFRSPGLSHLSHLKLLRGERVAAAANSTDQTEWSHCSLPTLGRGLSNTHIIFLWSRYMDGSSHNQQTTMPTQP